MSESIKNYINGEWIDAIDGKKFACINPADHLEVLGEIPGSDRGDVDQAVSSARAAFPAWRDTPAPLWGEVQEAPKGTNR